MASTTQQLIGFKRKPGEGPALSVDPMVDLPPCSRARASRHWDSAVCLRLPGLEKDCSRPDQCPYYIGENTEA